MPCPYSLFSHVIVLFDRVEGLIWKESTGVGEDGTSQGSDPAQERGRMEPEGEEA